MKDLRTWEAALEKSGQETLVITDELWDAAIDIKILLPHLRKDYATLWDSASRARDEYDALVKLAQGLRAKLGLDFYNPVMEDFLTKVYEFGVRIGKPGEGYGTGVFDAVETLAHHMDEVLAPAEILSKAVQESDK